MASLIHAIRQIDSHSRIPAFENAILSREDIRLDERLLDSLAEELESTPKDEIRLIRMHLIISVIKKCLQEFYTFTEWYQMSKKLIHMMDIFFSNAFYFTETSYCKHPDFNDLFKSAIAVFMSICKFDEAIQDLILLKLSDTILKIIISESVDFSIRKFALTIFGSCFIRAKSSVKKNVLRSNIKALSKMVNFIITCGDYETQEKLIDFFLRISPMFKYREKQLALWLKRYPEVSEAARCLNLDDFYATSREFLNLLNSKLGGLANAKVFTIACLGAYAGGYQLNKPIVRSQHQ